MDNEQHTDYQLFESLSQREYDILVLLAENLSNREIAARLVLAYTTVKWYNRQIFNKLGVDNRQQAVDRAYELGLLQPPTRLAHNLPTPSTPFVGRITELEDLTRQLGYSHNRLVTILAIGGMGKTRLALAAAESVLEHFVDGVYFVPLASLTSFDHLVPAISDAIRFHFSPDPRSPKQQLLDFLRAKRMLLVLDNFEHLLECTSLVAEILHTAPQIKILTTSRERLKLDGETVYTLDGLPYPAKSGAENVFNYAAVQLFIECAHRANFRFNAYDEVSIIQICQYVQGMPLALEMAAAWCATLTPAEIASEIMHSVDFLCTDMSNIPERMRNVRIIFEATCRRLNDDERRVFCSLSVFLSGCTRDAAQIVAGADLGMLAGLVGKALLRYKPESRRYVIHELLRQYAIERLEASGTIEMTWNTHRDYYGKLASEWGSALKTPKQLQALEILESDFDNIRQAFQRAIETGKPEVIEPFADLWYFYEIRSWHIEATRTFETAIEALKGHDSIALGKLLAGQSLFSTRFFKWDQARILAEQSIHMFHRLQVPHESVMPMFELGEALINLGDLHDGCVVWQEALELAGRCEDQWAISCALFLLGTAAAMRNRFAEAKILMSQSTALMTSLGNVWGLGFTSRDLAHIAYRMGDYNEAKRLFEQALANAQKAQHSMNTAAALAGLRLTARANGELLLARRYGEEELIIGRNSGNPLYLFWALLGLAEVSIASGSEQESRRYLREALTMANDIDDFICIRFLSVAVTFLIQAGGRTEAVSILSFLKHHPQWDTLAEDKRNELQLLLEEMQSMLAPDTYLSAWEQGQTLTMDYILTNLHIQL